MLPNETLATTNIAIVIGIILDDEIGFVAIIFPKKTLSTNAKLEQEKKGEI